MWPPLRRASPYRQVSVSEARRGGGALLKRVSRKSYLLHVGTRERGLRGAEGGVWGEGSARPALRPPPSPTGVEASTSHHPPSTSTTVPSPSTFLHPPTSPASPTSPRSGRRCAHPLQSHSASLHFWRKSPALGSAQPRLARTDVQWVRFSAYSHNTWRPLSDVPLLTDRRL